MSYDSELDDALDDGVLTAAEQRILKRLDAKKLRQFLKTQGDDYKVVDRPNQGEVDYESLGADTPLKQYLVDNYNERDKNFQGEKIYDTVKQEFPGATALDIRDSLTDLDMQFGKETRNYPQKLEDEWVKKQKEIIQDFDYDGEPNPDKVKIDVREWLYDKRNKGVYDTVMRGEDPGNFRIDTIQKYKGGKPGNNMNIAGQYELQFYANDQLYGTAPAETEDENLDEVRSVDDYLEMSGVTDSTFEGVETIELKKKHQDKMDKFENETDKIIESASNINKGFELGEVPSIKLPKLTNLDKLKDRISNDAGEFKKLPNVTKLAPTIRDPSGEKRKEKREMSKLGPVGSKYKAPDTEAFDKGNPTMPPRAKRKKPKRKSEFN